MSKRFSNLKFGLFLIAAIFAGILIFRIIGFPGFFQNILIQAGSPFVFVGEKSVGAVSGAFNFFINLKNVSSDNRALRVENLALFQELSELKNREADWNFSQKIISGFENEDYEFILARVVGRDPYYLNSVFFIDKGRDDGIKDGMTALSGGKFVVGQVKNAADSLSEVLMLTNPESSTSVIFQNSGLIGVAKGDRGLGIFVDILSLEDEAIAGESVATSGLDAIFPPGLIVGQVERIETREDGIRRVRVKLPFDYKKIDRVAVIAEKR